jgi:hypothetical protein
LPDQHEASFACSDSGSPEPYRIACGDLPTRLVPADGAEVRGRRPSGLRAVGPYPTVLGPATPTAPLTGGRIADARPTQWPRTVLASATSPWSPDYLAPAGSFAVAARLLPDGLAPGD